MPYNNVFPMTYQPYYPTQTNAFPTQMSVSSTQPTQNGIIWVQGEAGAKSYLVAPNNTVQLWDSESQTIYLKSADASGMPSMKILDYKFRDLNLDQNQIQQTRSLSNVNDNYATKDEVNGLKEELRKLKAGLLKVTEVAKDESKLDE